MLQKICFISFVLIFICLYLYVKIESFENVPISNQLTSEIGRVLDISSSRIINLQYTGDPISGSLMVGFFILEPTAADLAKGQPSAADAAKLAQQMTISETFKVFVNGYKVTLKKLPKPDSDTNKYFDNPALKDVANYAIQKSISVPNDPALTNFYKLGFDSNFNVVPQLTPITTSQSTKLFQPSK